MGQQQLLIIVLGVLIVGLAVYSGLQLMHSYTESHNRDLIIHRLNILVGDAKAYAAKPRSLGGGEGSYLGFSPPAKLTSTPDMSIYTTAGDDWVLFQAYGTSVGADGQNPVQIIGQFDRSTNNWSTLATVN